MIQKKLLNFIIQFSFVFLFLSCSKKTPDIKKNISTGEIIIQDNSSVSIPSPESLDNNEESHSSKIDFDLTKMSSTMIYSTVFDMLISAEDYLGRNIRVKGNFQVFVNDDSGERYYAILIPDATACCQQGIEFIWVGEHNYPQDYPEIGQEVTITGVYKETENEDGITYTYLKVSSLVF